jgi:hypothetical protein
MDELLWERVGQLTDRALRLSDLRHHRLQLLAASRMRARGENVPPELVREERMAAAVGLAARVLMQHARRATDARIIVMKGPEAAALWPNPRLRAWKDLDLLVEDAAAVQDALLEAGFVEVGDPAIYEHIHHLRPLTLPGLPVCVEVHLRPKWPTPDAPSFSELVAAAVPSSFGLSDVFAPKHAHHAVLLAAHAWEHDPLSRLASLADISAMAGEAGFDAAAQTAERWGVERIWRITARTIEDVLRRPSASREPMWRRHLSEARERTVLEGHLARLAVSTVSVPVTRAPAAALRSVANTLRLEAGETWTIKAKRTVRALGNASTRKSEHDATLIEHP